MNPQHLVSKTSASANWTTRALMAFREGVKPSTSGFVDQCSIQLSYRNWSGQSGSNRRHLRWQRSALPLSYTRTNFGGASQNRTGFLSLCRRMHYHPTQAPIGWGSRTRTSNKGVRILRYTNLTNPQYLVAILKGIEPSSLLRQRSRLTRCVQDQVRSSQ